MVRYQCEHNSVNYPVICIEMYKKEIYEKEGL